MNKKLQAVLEKMPKEGYVFNKEAHIHALDGKALTGVTTILSVIAKPALIQWSADETAKYLGWINQKYDNTVETYLGFVKFWQENIKDKNADEFFNLLCEARVQHAKRKKDAGTIGTDAHAEIEIVIKDAIQNGMGWITTAIAKDKLVSNFIQWAKDNHVKFLESEKHVYSRSNWYGGICDFVCEIEGKIWIGDIKTSSAVYPEHFFQTSAYQLALQEMGDYPEIEGHVIVNCKKNGEFEVQKSYGYAQNVEAFKAALTIYRAQEALKATM